MKLKQLEGLLGGLTQFPEPKVILHRRRVSPFFHSHLPTDRPPQKRGGEIGGIYVTFLPVVAVQVELEQYPTGPHIASRMLYTVKCCVASRSDSDVFHPFLGFWMRRGALFCDVSGIGATKCCFGSESIQLLGRVAFLLGLLQSSISAQSRKITTILHVIVPSDF
jgi:hypothetical protein